jgi:hypothetical protein
MNIFENVKFWTINGDSKSFLEPVGKNEYSNGDVTVRVKTKTNGKMTAVYIDAEKKRMHFASNYAVGFSAEKIDGLKRYFGNHMYCAFWCRSDFSDDLTKLHVDTQGFIYEKNDGKYSLILPVCDTVYKCTLFGDSDGINAGLSSYYPRLSKVENSLAFIIYDGADSPYGLVREAAEYAFELLGTGLHTREYRRYPEMFDYLGWCSWDAMQINVTEEGLLEKCKEFADKDIPVKWAIIDDMWADCRGLNDRPFLNDNMYQQMHATALTSFEADKVRFPKGLKHCVTEMKKYGLKVGMWHPTSGYWKGVDPEGPLAKEFADCLEMLPNGNLNPRMDKEKLFKFYNAFHTFFKECGVEFVKIDNQSFLRGHYTNIYPVGYAARELHAGLEASVGKNFDNNIINCMCMAIENQWNRPTSAINRCSGDFQPENREWFITHILQCVYSSMFQGEFYYNDFDMWWTDDGQAGKNSLLRAISGGPIYVSDKIGRSNKHILDPLAFDDGRILRCDRPARPTLDSLFNDPQTTKVPLKIFNTCKGGKYGVLAAYNLDKKNRPVRGTISPDDIIGLEGEEFAVYEYNTKKVRFLKRGESFSFMLKDHDDYRHYIISPIDENGIAMLGRIDKFMSPCAVTDKFMTTYNVYEGGKIAFVNRGKRAYKAISESGSYKIERTGSLCTFELPREDKHFTLK